MDAYNLEQVAFAAAEEQRQGRTEKERNGEENWKKEKKDRSTGIQATFVFVKQEARGARRRGREKKGIQVSAYIIDPLKISFVVKE